MSNNQALGRSLKISALAALCIGLVLTVSACARGGARLSRPNSQVVTFAEQPGSPPNYILPLESGSYESLTNLEDLVQLMYLPLYWFGDNGKPLVNYKLSAAEPPTFSSHDTVVTVTLKQWRWSDGQPLTARDVTFWMNLLTAVTDPNAPAIGSSSAPGPGWGYAVPGGFPENVKSYTITGPRTIVFQLNASYNPTWFLYNELSQVYPLPQKSWDRLALNGPNGNFDLSAQARTTIPKTSPIEYVPNQPGTATTGALGVAQFLNSQAQDLSTYASSPLWKVVDGPFHLADFTSSGFAKFVPNALYSGTPKPSISAFEELPFTTATAEFDAVKDGSLSVGYVPFHDANQASNLRKIEGYSLNPWYNYMSMYLPYNFTNPAVAPLFDQLYFRQAMQSLVNQPEYIAAFQAGYGLPTNGPVPNYPVHGPFQSPLVESRLIYSYSPARAVTLLREHGWSIVPGGSSYCARPGVGPLDCGRGISKGETAHLTLLYQSGLSYVANEVSAFASALSEYAGITLTIKGAPLGEVVGITFAGCTYATPCSNWEIADFTGWEYDPDYLPTGGEIFFKGSASNTGDYSSGTNDMNIRLTHTASTASGERSAIFRYENYLAEQLPALWFPSIPLQLTVYKSNLRGVVPQGIYSEIYPQAMRWS